MIVAQLRIVLWCLLAAGAYSFTHHAFRQILRLDFHSSVDPRFVQRHRRQTVLHINFGWFSGKGDNEENEELDPNSLMGTAASATNAGIGGVATTMKSMESFKRSQRVGRMTRKLLQELSSTTVEGSAADGKVKVVLDCQQRAVRVDIDQGYKDEVGASDLGSAITSAMNDAHSRSLERMDDKMKNFYTEVGFPNAS